MPHNRQPIPIFNNETEEQAFWQEQDSTRFLDWSGAQKLRFPNLKPSTERISLRLPKDLLEDLKILANKQDVPYQSLIKHLLYQSVHPKP